MYRSKIVKSILVLSLALGTTVARPSTAASARSSAALSFSQLTRQIRSLVEQKGLRSIQWGVCLADAKSGKVLFAYNADELFIPASNRKLFVSALALHHLGPDYRFHTPLYLSAPHENGEPHFHGDLIVRGVGDPTFLNPKFNNGSVTSTLEEWADVLKDAGIEEVHGDIIMDDSGFESGGQTADGWTTDYETAQYAPRASGICYSGNCIAIAIRPAQSSGAPARVTVSPSNSVVEIDNQTRTGSRGSNDTIVIERDNGGADRFVVKGNLPAGAKQQAQRIPVEQPGLVAGDVFRRILTKNGITVDGKVCVGTADLSTTVSSWVKAADYASPPLSEILAVVNKNSDNHGAEQLFQAVAYAKSGHTSYRDAKRFEETFLAEVGILPDEANFEDGSGLSRMNLVTPRATTRLLAYMANHPEKDTFIGSLAVAGRDGTLSNRMGRRAIGRVHAKTGALSVACSLSGYAESRSGQSIAFSILANETNGRTGDVCYVQDKICNWIVSASF